MKSLVLFAAASAALVSAACYGSHSVYYIDSAREPGTTTVDHDLDEPRVQSERCAKTGVAEIETYSSWLDELSSYMTFSEAARSVEITCAKER